MSDSHINEKKAYYAYNVVCSKVLVGSEVKEVDLSSSLPSSFKGGNELYLTMRVYKTAVMFSQSGRQ